MVVSVLTVAACSTSPQRPEWTAIAANQWYTCGLDADGVAYCWGDVPSSRDGTTNPLPSSTVPVRLESDIRFRQVTVGEGMVCGVSVDDEAFCWGANNVGQLGDGTSLARTQPSLVSGDRRWKRLAAGSNHVCGVTLQGEAYCWGSRFRGKLGDGQLSGQSQVPVKATTSLTFETISAGSGSTCAIASGGDAYCWGVNDLGLLGDGEPPEGLKQTASPTAVVGGLKWSVIAVGDYSACAITVARRAYCWGQAALGDLQAQPTSTPIEVPGALDWRAIAAGSGHTCGVTSSLEGYCWGNDEHGQLGNGQTGKEFPLGVVSGEGQYVSVATGGRHTCAIDLQKRIACWGRGDFGQLGIGIATDRNRPSVIKDPF